MSGQSAARGVQVVQAGSVMLSSDTLLGVLSAFYQEHRRCGAVINRSVTEEANR